MKGADSELGQALLDHGSQHLRHTLSAMRPRLASRVTPDPQHEIVTLHEVVRHDRVIQLPRPGYVSVEEKERLGTRRALATHFHVEEFESACVVLEHRA